MKQFEKKKYRQIFPLDFAKNFPYKEDNEMIVLTGDVCTIHRGKKSQT